MRILDGQDEIVSHRRSYDRDQYIDEAGHEEALLEKKRRAQGQTPSGRLTAAVPETQAFVQAAFAKGENAGSTTLKLLRLLDDYGAEALRAAVVEALERETPRISSVAYLLERRRRAQGTRTPLPVDFSRRPDLADLVVRPHEAETYDELSHTDGGCDRVREGQDMALWDCARTLPRRSREDRVAKAGWHSYRPLVPGIWRDSSLPGPACGLRD